MKSGVVWDFLHILDAWIYDEKKNREDETDILGGMLGPATSLNVFQTGFVEKWNLRFGNRQRLWVKFFFQITLMILSKG